MCQVSCWNVIAVIVKLQLTIQPSANYWQRSIGGHSGANCVRFLSAANQVRSCRSLKWGCFRFILNSLTFIFAHPWSVKFPCSITFFISITLSLKVRISSCQTHIDAHAPQHDTQPHTSPGDSCVTVWHHLAWWEMMRAGNKWK